jgi:hypothetical protein
LGAFELGKLKKHLHLPALPCAGSVPSTEYRKLALRVDARSEPTSIPCEEENLVSPFFLLTMRNLQSAFASDVKKGALLRHLNNYLSEGTRPSNFQNVGIFLQVCVIPNQLLLLGGNWDAGRLP